MNRAIYVTGQNSGEIYTVSVPSGLLGFCNFDFTPFMERCGELCRRSMRTGEYPVEEAIQLRSSILQCHRYYEQNMRGIFDKIVIDCWIEYICRQNEIGTVTLWNNFMPCRNEFERTIFVRLSEYRGRKAINQWVNLLKIQDYALKKIEFIFGGNVGSVPEAVSRSNCFDLMFGVAANEQGYSLGEIGATRVYRPGQLPNAPFVLSGAAKEINKNILGEVSYNDIPAKENWEEDSFADQDAMKAFALIRNHLPQSGDLVVNTVVKTLMRQPRTVYVPSGFKAMIDLEIDAMLEGGMFLRRCKRCKQFFVCDDSYNEQYCDRVNRDGRTCLEIMKAGKEVRKEPLSVDEMALLKEKSDEIYKEMTARVGIDFTQRDMSEWYSYLSGIRGHVLNGEATMKDFDNFMEYSRSISFQKKPEATEQPEVKPYQFQRVDRKELERQGLLSPSVEDLTPPPTVKPGKAVPNRQPPPARVIRNAPVSGLQPPTVIIPNGDRPEPLMSSTSLTSMPSVSELKPEAVQDTSGFQPFTPAGGKLEHLSQEPPEEPVKVYGQHPESAPVKEYIPKNEVRKDPKKRIQEKIFEEFVMSSPQKESEPEIKIPTEPSEPKDDDMKTYSKTARVVSAYRTVKEMTAPAAPEEQESPKPSDNREREEHRDNAESVSPVLPISREEEPEASETSRPAIDFSQILQGIERNDGFEDEENIPLDPDGIPLSHKTKHVMDAIMKPSKVSPSLGFARKNDDNK